METIRLKSNDIENLQKLGRGACAIVYRYEDNLALKVFNEKGIELHNSEGFSEIVGIENGTCIFPKCLIEIDQKFQGYAMQYIEGIELEKVIKELDFESLILAIQKVEEDLKSLAKDKIVFNDLNLGGIMWGNNDQIKIIDTDFFEKNDKLTEEKCYSYNIKEFNMMIELSLGYINGLYNKVISFLQSYDEYNEFYSEYFISSVMENNISVTELLKKSIKIFEKEFGKKPTNMKEMEEMVTDREIIEIENIDEYSDEDIENILRSNAYTEDNKQEGFINYDKIIEEIPDGLTQIEKARYIYIQLGKYFSYDERYITSESDDERKEIFDKNIGDIENDKVVCTSLSRIYENLLKRVGIKAKTILIPGERLGHAFTEIEIDGKKYFTGLIRDLMNIKTGLKTKEFMIDNPDRFGEDLEYTALSEDELKRIDDKIGYTYNRNVYGRIYKNDKRRNGLIG